MSKALAEKHGLFWFDYNHNGGLINEGTFVPFEPVVLPKGSHAIVTILDFAINQAQATDEIIQDDGDFSSWHDQMQEALALSMDEDLTAPHLVTFAKENNTMSYYKINKLYPWLYSIYDPQNVFCYLIIGEKSALLFDTGYGKASLDDAIRQVCDLPYEVVLSHGHWDHVNGAHQFEEKWIHPADVDLLQNQHVEDVGKLKMLKNGQIFDLDNLTVEVVPMEGHTAGSIGLLIREHKLLLDADAANYHMWMFLDECLDVDVYINMLKRVREMDFDTFIVGHSNLERPKSDFDKYLAVAQNFDYSKSILYPTFEELGGRMYEEGDVNIILKPK